MAFSALTTTTSVEFQKVFIAPPQEGQPCSQSVIRHGPPPGSWQLPVCVPSPWLYQFWLFHINGILQCVTFHTGRLSLSLKYWRSTHMWLYQSFLPFLWPNNIVLHVYSTVHSSIIP